MISKSATGVWSQILGYSLAGLIGAGVAVVSMRTFGSNQNASQPVSQSPNVTTVSQRPAISAQEGDFVAVAAKQVGPAVVRIDTESILRIPADPALNDPFLRRFFGLENTPPRVKQELRRGIGSGFIIASRGIVLTNAHVLEGADKVTVTLTDGRTFSGEVRGKDLLMDLAVVKINPNGQELPVAPLGDSSKVRVGDWAIAVGNPLGLNSTVTLGIVSNLSRSSSEIGIPDKRLDFIQTDAAINPGNSGGPLLNKAGEVIGINTAIRSDAQGIGFAIPVNIVKATQELLEAGKKVLHPFLGVQMVTLTPQLAQENNRQPDAPLQLPEINGVLILQAVANSPAAGAGLRLGDVMVELNGQKVITSEQVQQEVEKSQVGQVLQLKVRRGDQTIPLSVRVGNLQETR